MVALLARAASWFQEQVFLQKKTTLSGFLRVSNHTNPMGRKDAVWQSECGGSSADFFMKNIITDILPTSHFTSLLILLLVLLILLSKIILSSAILSSCQ
mmetsp:Transcript_6425/g.15993  ORF Transcript_6425/g.15993 Transcript_6425/m.15993 type:complete len:99 (-) Transcript_6425:265-561(-)